MAGRPGHHLDPQRMECEQRHAQCRARLQRRRTVSGQLRQPQADEAHGKHQQQKNVGDVEQQAHGVIAARVQAPTRVLGFIEHPPQRLVDAEQRGPPGPPDLRGA